MELCFRKHLQKLEKLAPRKGDRTRIRLRVATIEVLDRVGYHGMRVSDIAAAACITPGSLYQYYPDKLHVTLSVLDEFQEFFTARQNAGGDGSARPHFAAIRDSNLRFLRLIEQNRGLVRCFLQVADDEPEFARRYYAASHRQNLYIAGRLQKRLGASQDRLPAITAVVYALGAMMDEVARRLLVQQDPELRGVLETADLDTEVLAGVLASLWYRSLYASDCPESEASLAGALGTTARTAPPAPKRRSAARR